MKILSWNCGGWSCGGFNINKYKEIMCFQPEIILIQECTKNEFDYISMVTSEERTKLLPFLVDFKYPLEDELKIKNFKYDNSKLQHWYGDDVEESYKGTAIFSTTCNYNIELVDNFNKEFRYVIPYRIYFVAPLIRMDEIILLSIWTKLPSDGSWNYQKTIFDALDYYNFNEAVILVGDFNTGSNKNNKHRYEELKTKLNKYNLKNCAENSEFEYEPTFFHDKTNDYFTNDFCFIPKYYDVNKFYIDKMNNQKRWRNLSDHCPLIADFEQKDVIEALDYL